MRYRYYIEKMQQTFSQWLGKIPKKEHTMYTRVKVLCIVCGAYIPGGCLATWRSQEGNLSFGISSCSKSSSNYKAGAHWLWHKPDPDRGIDPVH